MTAFFPVSELPGVRTFGRDYARGKAAEAKHTGALERYLGDTFLETSTYHPMDLQGTRCWVEVKDRTFASGRYPTTMVPSSKVAFAKRSTLPVHFVFAFTDGLYITEFDATRFASYEERTFCRSGRVDKTDVPQPYTYVPVEHLTRIPASS